MCGRLDGPGQPHPSTCVLPFKGPARSFDRHKLAHVFGQDVDSNHGSDVSPACRFVVRTIHATPMRGGGLFAVAPLVAGSVQEYFGPGAS